jgi:soluble lytic murein transglycosylase-like protein
MFTLLAIAVASHPSSAQVIEIGADGTHRMIDRPMRYDADGAIAIRNEPPATSPREPTGEIAAAAASDPWPSVAAAARAHRLPPSLLEAVAWRESRGRQSAISPKGAIGVMQLMPDTAADLGVDPRDRLANIEGGARYLRMQLDRFGSVPLALAAYNAGPGAVQRHGGIPPYRETRAYVSAIMAQLGTAAPEAPAAAGATSAFNPPVLMEIAAP